MDSGVRNVRFRGDFTIKTQIRVEIRLQMALYGEAFSS